MSDWNQIVTVNGNITPEELGITYVHEHVMVKPQLPDEKYDAYTLDDEAKSCEEVKKFAGVGGHTIVEMTPIHYGRNVRALQRIAKQTGTKIICTTGYHKELFQPRWFCEKNDEELYEILIDEILNGMDGSDVHPGVVKFGTSYNEITKQEERAIRVVAKVHKNTGIPLSTHCDKGTMGMEQVKRLDALGVDLRRVLLCHIDSAEDYEYAKELCKTGVHICFDHVGRELENHDQLRVQMLVKLIEDGFIRQLHISGDMGKKDYFTTYGGRPGLTYILTDLKEELLKYISLEDYNQIMIGNPARYLAGEP